MSKILSALQSEALNLLRFPLALIVVLIHVFSVLPTTFNVDPNIPLSLFDKFSIIISAFLRGISVPIYFFISGYVFFREGILTKQLYVNKLKNRSKSLLAPYIIWNAVAVLLIVIKSAPVFSSFLSYSGTTCDLSFSNILSCFWEYNGKLSPPPSTVTNYEDFIRPTPYPINTALWFLRDLMIVVLCTPVIFVAIKKIRIYFILLLSAIYIVTNYWIVDYHVTQLSTAFFFFSWGAYMSINKLNFLSIFDTVKKETAIFYVVNSIAYMLVTSRYPLLASTLKLINTFLAVVVSFNIASFLIVKKHLSSNVFLSSSSFFIYITHCLITARVTKVLFMTLKPNSDIQVLSVYLLTFVIVITFLLITFYLLRRFTPRLLKVIAGRK